MNTTTRTINGSATCDCGASKNPRYPACRSCNLDRKVRKALTEPLHHRRLTTRAEEGRKWMTELMSNFASFDRLPHSHWHEDRRGLDETLNASEHSGTIGEFSFSHEFEHLPHSVAVRRSRFFEHRDAIAQRQPGTSSVSRPFYRQPNDLTSSYDHTAAEFSEEYGNITLAIEDRRHHIQEEIEKAQSIADDARTYGIPLWHEVSAKWANVRALNQEIRALRLQQAEALQRATASSHTRDVYIPADPALNQDNDSALIDADRIHSRLTHPTRTTRLEPAFSVIEYVEGVAVCSLSTVLIPVIEEPRACAWPLPTPDAYSDALLEDELRKDYPQLFVKADPTPTGAPPAFDDIPLPEEPPL
jgi:hypothetical protein